MLLLYSSLLKTYFRARFGEPPDLSPGREGRGLVIVADGVGGLDLCGTGLRYVIGALKIPYVVKVVSWGHGFGRWHADLTNAANRDLRAAEIADTVRVFREEFPSRPGIPGRQVGRDGAGRQGAGALARGHGGSAPCCSRRPCRRRTTWRRP